MFCLYTLPLARPAQAKIQMLTTHWRVIRSNLLSLIKFSRFYMTIWRWYMGTQALENTSSKLILTHHEIPSASFSSFQKSFLAGTNAVLKTLSEQGVTSPSFFNFFTMKWNISGEVLFILCSSQHIKVHEKMIQFHQRLKLNSISKHKMQCSHIGLSCSEF